MASGTTYRIGSKDVTPGRLLAELTAACPALADFLKGCGGRKRTGADFDLEGHAIHVDDWSQGGPWVSIHLDLAKDTFIDFSLNETGAEAPMLVYSGRDADRAYELDDAWQDGTTLGRALGDDVALPTFLVPHADLKVLDGDYMPFDGDIHQTSLTLAEPGSGKSAKASDGGPAKGKSAAAEQKAAIAAAQAAQAARGR